MVFLRRLSIAIRSAIERQARARAAMRRELERELLGVGRAATPRTDEERIAQMQALARRRLRAALLSAIVKPFVMAAARQRYLALPEVNSALAQYVKAKLDAREIRTQKPINRLRVALTVALAMNTLESVAYAAQRRRMALFDRLRSLTGVMARRGLLAEMRAYGYPNREALRKARREALLGTSFSKEIFKAAAFSTANAVILAAMRVNALTLGEYRKVRERANAVLNLTRHMSDPEIPRRALRTAQGVMLASIASTAFVEPVAAAAFRQERIVLPQWTRQVRRLCEARSDAARSIDIAMHRELLGADARREARMI